MHPSQVAVKVNHTSVVHPDTPIGEATSASMVTPASSNVGTHSTQAIAGTPELQTAMTNRLRQLLSRGRASG